MGETSSTPSTAFERWRKSLVNFTGLGVSPEEASAREQGKGEEFLRSQRQACILWRNDLLRSSVSNCVPQHARLADHLLSFAQARL
jgi:hypothetical protein